MKRIFEDDKRRNYFFFSFAFLLCFLTRLHAASLGNSSCLDKEEALSILETAEDFLSKANDAYPSCNQTECGGSLALSYMEISKKLISDLRRKFPTCPNVSVQHDVPRDCTEILANGRNKSGLYTVWPRESCKHGKPLEVYCDMETDYGGWTVIQRRGKYQIQQDFYQEWEAYKNGFGNLSEEFWLGNENIRILCHKGCELRIDLQAKNGSIGFAVYRNFNLTKSSYTLYTSHYTGNIGNGLESNHNNRAFSTKDKGEKEKARLHQGGWWYHTGESGRNLNGIYQPDISGHSSVYWGDWRGTENLAKVEMKVRPK